MKKIITILFLIMTVSFASAYFPKGLVIAPPPPTPDLVFEFTTGAVTNCTLATCLANTRADSVQWFDSAGAWFTCSPNTLCLNGFGLLNQAPSTNLILWSQDLDNAYWTKTNVTITANSTIAPDGTSTADTITDTATNSFHAISEGTNATFVNGFTYAFSKYVKAGTHNYVQMTVPFGQFSNIPYANYDLTTCKPTLVASNSPAVIASPIGAAAGGQPVAGGYCWLWLIAKATSNAANSGLNLVMINDPLSVRAPVYPGTGGSVIAWGLQVETLAPSSYMATAGSTTSRAGDQIQAIGALATALNGSQGYVATTQGQMYGPQFVPGGVIVGRNNITDTILQLTGLQTVSAKSANSNIAPATIGSAPSIGQGPTKLGASWGPSKISTVANGGTVGTFAGTFSGSGTPYLMSPGPAVGGTTGYASGYLQKLTVGTTQPSDAALAAAAPVSGIPLGAGTIAVTVPANGDAVTGFETLTATSTNGQYLQNVAFLIDGSPIASTASWGSFLFNWNSASVLDGAHTIVATGTDLLGNAGTSPTINFTTNNGTAGGNIHYFANGGADTGNCTNIAAPCATISYANTLVYQLADQILFNGGDTFVGCLVINGLTNWLSTNANRGTIGSYGTGVATINPNCTGESGGIRVNAANGVIVQDLTVNALTIPTPRGAVILQNSTGSQVSGLVFQRLTLSGARYFQSTAPAGGQGQNGGDFFYEGFPGNGGFNGLQILNSTICGSSGNTSGDDSAIAGFGSNINILNVTIQGNIACNIGGGPVAAAGFGKAYPPMGDGIHIQAMNTVLSQFNLAHDNGGNMSSCGGPAGTITASANTVTAQFSESYNITYVPAGALNYPTGWCDGEGGDFDNDTLNALGQYFYSHDNAGPSFLLFMNNTGCCSGWNNNTWRYSIGENDDRTGSTGLAQLTFQPLQSGHTGNMYNMTEWNNLVFNGSAFGNTNVCAPGFAVNTASALSGVLKNSIFSLGACTSGGGGWEPANMRGVATPTGLVISNNIYHNRAGAAGGGSWWFGATLYTSLAAWQGAVTGGDPGSSTSNPLISGTPPFGVCTWTPSSGSGPQPCPGGTGTPTYGVSAGSPAISGGTAIGAVPTTPTRDYYGNAVPGTGPCTNIGAYGVCP